MLGLYRDNGKKMENRFKVLDFGFKAMSILWGLYRGIWSCALLYQHLGQIVYAPPAPPPPMTCSKSANSQSEGWAASGSPSSQMS